MQRSGMRACRSSRLASHRFRKQLTPNQNSPDFTGARPDLAAAGALRLHVRKADMSLHRIEAHDLLHIVSANNSRPINIRLISLVPAPIS